SKRSRHSPAIDAASGKPVRQVSRNIDLGEIGRLVCLRIYRIDTIFQVSTLNIGSQPDIALRASAQRIAGVEPSGVGGAARFQTGEVFAEFVAARGERR